MTPETLKREAEKLVSDATNKYGAIYPTSELLTAIEELCERVDTEARKEQRAEDAEVLQEGSKQC